MTNPFAAATHVSPESSLRYTPLAEPSMAAYTTPGRSGCTARAQPWPTGRWPAAPSERVVNVVPESVLRRTPPVTDCPASSVPFNAATSTVSLSPVVPAARDDVTHGQPVQRVGAHDFPGVAAVRRAIQADRGASRAEAGKAAGAGVQRGVSLAPETKLMQPIAVDGWKSVSGSHGGASSSVVANRVRHTPPDADAAKITRESLGSAARAATAPVPTILP